MNFGGVKYEVMSMGSRGPGLVLYLAFQYPCVRSNSDGSHMQHSTELRIYGLKQRGGSHFDPRDR
jgi:hypothetical protein